MSLILKQLKRLVRNQFTSIDEQIDFNIESIYQGHRKVTYRGVSARRCPFDYVIYQMILSELRPDLVIEIGTSFGGGALYLADLLTVIGGGIVHTIDIHDKASDIVKTHPRITLFTEGWQAYDLNLSSRFDKVLVIDDASHIYEETLGAMRKFAPAVSPNSYLIVEDGIATELGMGQRHSGGPLRAINDFLATNSDFYIDEHWTDFFGHNATFNIKGYLRRGENVGLSVFSEKLL